MSGNKFFEGKNKKEIKKTHRFLLDVSSKKSVKSKINTKIISKEELFNLYINNGKSMKEISKILDTSLHKITYWMEKYKITRRSRSEATYIKRNPNGDPFLFIEPRIKSEHLLFGLGLGLYWGEGTKAEKTNSVRLGNTDPKLIELFMKFLIDFFSVKKEDFRFCLQIFTDIPKNEALDFWTEKLKINRKQFYKVVVTRSRSLGTYRKKSRFGVLTVYYNNKKLKDKLVSLLPM